MTLATSQTAAPVAKKAAPEATKATMGDLRRIVQLGRPRWGLVVAGTSVLLVEAGATLAFPLLTRNLIDGLSAPGQTGASLWSNGALLGLIAVLLVAALAAAVGKYLLSKTGLAMMARLKQALVAKLITHPVGYFDTRESGEHVSRVNHDTGTIAKLVSDATPNLMSGVVLLIGSALVLCLLDLRLAGVLFGIIFTAFLIMLPAIARTAKITFDQNQTMARLAGQLTQLFGNVRLVKSFTAERIETERAAGEIQALYRHGLRAARLQSMLQPVITLAMTCALVSIFVYGGSRIVEGTLTIGTLTAFILYIFNVIAPLVQLSAFATALQSSRGAAVSLLSILEAEVEHDAAAGDSAAKVPARGGLLVEGLRFGYDNCPPLLAIDRLEIPHGSRTAIIGPSGSGKTSLLSLIERFYEPQAGAICYGGVPIGTLPIHEWRRKIGYVAQNAPVFSGTIRENILYGTRGPAAEGDVIAAARAANCLEFITRLDHGFDTLVGEDGVRLSGGQRQRLAIARMFMRDPEILLLDEATANLDGEAERLVLAAIHNLMGNRTVIMVTHRLGMAETVDQIVVVEDGRVAATGSHAELAAAEGYYARLAG
jgi:ATP-binding cassette subfamily B protein AbcA/BmrA